MKVFKKVPKNIINKLFHYLSLASSFKVAILFTFPYYLYPLIIDANYGKD